MVHKVFKALREHKDKKGMLDLRDHKDQSVPKVMTELTAQPDLRVYLEPTEHLDQ